MDPAASIKKLLLIGKGTPPPPPSLHHTNTHTFLFAMEINLFNYVHTATLVRHVIILFIVICYYVYIAIARLNRAGLGPDLAHFSGTVYIATKTSSVDPSPVRGARLYVLPFYSFLDE